MNVTPGSWQCTPAFFADTSAEMAKNLLLPTTAIYRPRLLIGRREWIALPDLSLPPLIAKIDTGARTSTLHAEKIHFDEQTGIVHFHTIGPNGRLQSCTCRAVKVKHVRNSGGTGQSRIVIRTSLAFPGGFSFITDFTLANRKAMRYPVLLGRRAINGYFVIDPQHTHLLGNF